MRHENETPAKRRRLAALSTIVVVGLVAVAATVVGPAKAIDWLVNYLIPVGVITGVIIASLALLVWAVKRLPNPPYRNWWQ
jgi:protein-S-isoprenylcysteine O-methyltransferase Ste14